MGRGKVRKGRGGRVMMESKKKDGSRGMASTPISAGKVLYCEKCAGTHTRFNDVRACFGREVRVGLDYRWVKP